MPNHRKYRIEEEVRREIADMLRDDIKDPRIKGLISVTHVEMTKDYSRALIFVSSLAEKQDKQKMLKGLSGANGFIRKELARRLSLRFTPEIEFVLDNSIENGVNISKMISELSNTGAN